GELDDIAQDVAEALRVVLGRRRRADPRACLLHRLRRRYVGDSRSRTGCGARHPGHGVGVGERQEVVDTALVGLRSVEQAGVHLAERARAAGANPLFATLPALFWAQAQIGHLEETALLTGLLERRDRLCCDVLPATQEVGID